MDEKTTQTTCPNCGSTKIKFERESVKIQGGYGHRTVGLCKDCGYTWQPNFGPSKKKGHSIWWWILAISFYPISLSIWFYKTERVKLPQKKRGVIIAGVWGLFLLLSIILGLALPDDYSGDKATALYDSAVVEEMMSGDGKTKLGEVSIIYADEEDCTDEVVADWAFNYVLENDYKYCLIVYNNTNPVKGIMGTSTSKMVEKDVTLEKDNSDNTYSVSDNSGSTLYSIDTDQNQLVKVYSEITEEEKNVLQSEIDSVISSKFKGDGYGIDVGGEMGSVDVYITLVKPDLDASQFEGIMAYLAGQIQSKNLGVGRLDTAFQTDRAKLVAIGSVESVSDYSGTEDISIKEF